MDESDRVLAGRLAAGDPSAFATLYAAHGASLYGYLLTATGRRERAEDLLQTVWLRLVRYRRRLGGVQSLRAYLFATARNEVRRERASVEVPSPPELLDESSAPRVPGVGEDGSALRHAVSRLSPERREVVALKVWHGLTFAEVGDVLAIPPNTAASRYRLALADLRGMLTETIDARR